MINVLMFRFKYISVKVFIIRDGEKGMLFMIE